MFSFLPLPVGADIARPLFRAPILFFLFFEKEKNRRGVRRSQLHSVSAGAAKTPYPQPSSFPNCDRFTGSQFGHLEFYNAARDLDDGGQAAFCRYGKNQDFHTPQVQSKALVDGESREPSERFSGRLFPFLIGTERRPSTAVGFREGRRRLRIWSFRRPGGSAMQ